jgi:hypothetical protein
MWKSPNYQFYTALILGCMNLRKKQLNYINIGAAGNKKFEPGLLSESNIIGLLCGRRAAANPLFLVRAASIVPSCETAVTEIDTPSTRRQPSRERERELKIPVFSINFVVGTRKKDALFVVFLETSQLLLFVSRLKGAGRAPFSVQQLACLARSPRHLLPTPPPPRPPFLNFSPSLTYAAHRPYVRGSAPCHVHSDQ